MADRYLVRDRNECMHDPIETAERLDAMGDRDSMHVGESLHDAADVVRGMFGDLVVLRTKLANAEAALATKKARHGNEELLRAAQIAVEQRDAALAALSKAHAAIGGRDSHGPEGDAACLIATIASVVEASRANSAAEAAATDALASERAAHAVSRLEATHFREVYHAAEQAHTEEVHRRFGAEADLAGAREELRRARQDSDGWKERYYRVRSAQDRMQTESAARIERERKRADSYLDQQLRAAGWRPSGDDLDALCETILGGLGRKGLGATELTTVRTLRTQQRDLAALRAAAATLAADVELGWPDDENKRAALEVFREACTTSKPLPDERPDGPALYHSSNGEAGDASVHCIGCDEERDEGHTYDECIAVLRADRERENGGRCDAEDALEQEKVAHAALRRCADTMHKRARDAAPSVIGGSKRRALQDALRDYEISVADAPVAATPTNGSPDAL